MACVRELVRGSLGRVACLIEIVLLFSSTSCVHPGAAAPAPGIYDFQARLLFEVPGARVNLAGGNLIVERTDLSVDTLLGTQEVGAVYNSALGQWTWSFDLTYDGLTFVDASGAAHDVSDVEPGRAIPGTIWVRLDANRMRTKGGLVYTFDPATKRLAGLEWAGRIGVALFYHVAQVSGYDRVIEVEQCRTAAPCSTVYSVAYDEHACVERITGPGGRVALFDHDPSCRLQVARDALDVARGWAGFRYEYDGEALTAVVNSEGERVEYEYLSGRLAAVVAVGTDSVRRSTFAYGFDTHKRLYFTLASSPASGTSAFRYDSFGRLHEKGDATGGLTRITWSGARPSAVTDVAGVTTHWVYEDDDPVEATLPSGNVVSIVYAPDNRNRQDPTSRPIQRVSDSLGTLVERSYLLGLTYETATNGMGEAVTIRETSEGSISAVIAASGEVTQVLNTGDHGHAGSVERHGIFSHRLYDEVGNLLAGDGVESALSPGRPGISRLDYDEDRNIVGIEMIGGTSALPFAEEAAQITIERGSDGRPLRISRPYGGDTELDYDSFGQLIERRERVDGQWRSTRFEYDGAGRLGAVELPNGMRRELTYNVLGRVRSLRLLRDGVVEKQLEQRYAQGRLISRRDSSHAGDEIFSYDAAGRLSSVVFPGGEVLEYGYDLRSREISRRFRAGPAGEVIRSLSFGFDAADRRTEIFDDGELVVKRTWQNGLESEISYGNGIVRKLEYVPETELLSTSETRDALGNVIEDTEMQWVECGTQKFCIVSDSLAQEDQAPWSPSFAVEAYGLFPMPDVGAPATTAGTRLDSWSHSAEANAIWSDGYQQAYDVLGNRLGVGNGVTLAEHFTYNAEHNRLIGSDRQVHHDYEYDEAGFLIRRDTQVLQWDASGRLRDLGDGTELEWDSLGRLLRSRVNGVESRFLFGGLVRANEAGQPVSIDLTDVEIFLASGERIYRQLDFRGNVQLVTGHSGEILLHYAYSPWGPRQVSGTYLDDRSFAGGSKLGDFILLGARIYDPETGRFISPDPIYHMINQFPYTLGNPVTLWDPTGMHAYSATRVMGEMFQMIGVSLIAFGGGVTAAGVVTVNPVAIGAGATTGGLGIGLVIGGTVMILSADGAGGTGGRPHAPAPSPPTPKTIEVNADADPGSGGCSPTALTSDRGTLAPLVVLLPIQLALAWLLLRRRRRRG